MPWTAQFLVLGVLIGVFLPAAGRAEPDEEPSPWEWKGELGLEARIFDDDGSPVTVDENLALTGRFEADRETGPFRKKIRLFGRMDGTDGDRNVLVLEEAWIAYRFGSYELRAGAEFFNWSATEAFHPADVMNSRNLDSDVENFEKLGEPMISLTRRIPRGEASLYFLPVHVAPELPPESSRLSLAPPGTTVSPLVRVGFDGEIEADSLTPQWAVRIAQSRGPVDFDFHFLRHIDRSQPAIFVDAEERTVTPVYLPVTQLGGTVQGVAGSWLVKLEWAHRSFEALEDESSPFGVVDQPDHTQVAFGLEYGQAHLNGTESTFFLEGQTVLGLNEPERARLSTFQRDLLIGYRHSFNDLMGRQLTALLIFDLERSAERLFSISFSQRLTDTLSLRTGLRLIDAPSPGEVPIGLEFLAEADQLHLSVIRRF